MPSDDTQKDELLARFSCDIKDYLDYLRDIRRLSPHTIRGYEVDLEAFYRWVERTKVDPYTLDTRRLRNYLIELGRAQYTDKTINRKLSSVRGFYSWLELEGKANASYITSMEGRKQAKHLPKVMGDADVQAMIKTAASNKKTYLALRDVCALELLYATGARISELCGIKLGDFESGYTQVRLFGKGSKERIVPIYRSAAQACDRYVKEARPQLATKAQERTDILLLSERGRALSADSFRKRYEKIALEAGVTQGVTPHTMRHTYATELLDGGADLRSVQELLGHASLSTTQIYTHLSVEGLKDTMRLAHPRADE